MPNDILSPKVAAREAIIVEAIRRCSMVVASVAHL